MSHGRLRRAVMFGGLSRAWEHGGRPYAAGTAGVGSTGALRERHDAGATSPLVNPVTGVRNATATRDMSSSAAEKTLTEDNVYSNLRRMEYAVRGPLLLRALEIEKELQKVRLGSDKRS